MFSIRFLSLKRRIWISISLITLLPAIILFYYFTGFYISWLTVTILAVIIFFGWWVVFEVFSSIVKVHRQSKKTLEIIGQRTPSVPNEVEGLESVLNVLSNKVKSSFEQLREFSQKTEALNREVSKKVFVLSTILHANDLFSKEAPPEEIIQFLAQRSKEILEMQACFCLLKLDISSRFITAACLGAESTKVEDIFEQRKKSVSQIKKSLIADSGHKVTSQENLVKELGFQNLALFLITSGIQIIGVLGVGNNKDNFVFSRDELEALNIFSQNVALIWEHRRLSIKVDRLEVHDYLTGLYNEKFIISRLDEEVKRSSCYQRPCGFLLMEICGYEAYEREFGTIEGERMLKKVSTAFKDGLRYIDLGARLGVNKFAAILIEKNKRQSREVAAKLKEKLDRLFKKGVKFYFSVSESPIDSTNAQGLLQSAQAELKALRKDEV